MICPHEECDYESSEAGVKRHYGAMHDGSIAKTQKTCKHPECEEKYEVYESRSGNGRGEYCSKECQYSHLDNYASGEEHVQYDEAAHETVSCKYCGDEFEEYTCRLNSGRGVFCSNECLNDWRSENIRGEEHPRYVDGEQRYYGRSWPEKREDALERADYTCEHPDCDEDDKSLPVTPHVHHIIPFRMFNDSEDANKLSNLLVLCPSHHSKIEPDFRLTEPMEMYDG